MRVLVITAHNTDPSYVGISTFLEYLGVPYTTLVATQQNLTEGLLWDASGGKYQAIFLATDTLGYAEGGLWKSAFEPAEWQILTAYEAKYGVRQVTYYTYPNSQYGLSAPTAVSTDQAPLFVKLTAQGQSFFSYLHSDVSIPIRYAYTYLARPVDTSTLSLVEDDLGNAIVSIRTYPDGRQNLAVTADNWRYLLHSQLLSYGIIRWATRGVHLGERTVYLMPQVDDIFLANDLFDPELGRADEGRTYRINASDMAVVEAWQNSVRARRDPSFQNFSLAMVFNGEGAVDSTDSLVTYFRAKQGLYQWISHTYSHPNLDQLLYGEVLPELQLNHQKAVELRLTKYKKQNLVTGDVSGLANSDAMNAMADFGIQYVVSNTSMPGQNNPSPNAGRYNTLQPSILEIPRRPTNIFTTASDVEEEEAQYNALYRAYWGRDLVYDEILDFESNLILTYMVTYDMDPLMFHQSNLRVYDEEGHFLLGDLIDEAMDKYAGYMTLPVLSPPMDMLGQRMAQRMAYNKVVYEKADLDVTWIPGVEIRLTLPITAKQSVVVPITGLQFGLSAGINTFKAGTYRNYGGQVTSWVQLNPGQSISIPFTGGELPVAPTP